MTESSSENHLEIAKLFFKKRPMKIHWIQLPDEIGNSLIKLFNEYELDVLAKNLELRIEILSQLQIEMNNIEFIIETVRADGAAGESKQNTYCKIREHVEKLYGLLPLKKLSTKLMIPKTSLWEMSPKNSKNKKSIKKRHVHSATQLPPSNDISKKDNLISIDNTKELQELHQMLARHNNKTQKKYSKSEKDLILQLVDRFGSKLVHEQVKVSYDTIARFLRQRERGYVVPSTKAEFMPVINTMQKFPGMGPMQIRDYNHRHFGVSMGVNTV